LSLEQITKIEEPEMVLKNINEVLIKRCLFFNIIWNIFLIIFVAYIKATHLEAELMDMRVSH